MTDRDQVSSSEQDRGEDNSKIVPFTITEAGIKKITESYPDKECLTLRFSITSNNEWTWYFEDEKSAEDVAMDYGKIKVLLDPYTIEMMKETVVIDCADDNLCIATNLKQARNQEYMARFDEAFSNLQVSLENNPKSHPYGYYFHDRNPAGAGGFHWHEDEESLLNEIKDNLYAWVTEDDELGDEIQDGLSGVVESAIPNKADIDWNVLQGGLSSYLSKWDMNVAWVGTFNSLCMSNENWPNYLRDRFHDDEKPIEEGELEEFIEYISQYGQS